MSSARVSLSAGPSEPPGSTAMLGHDHALSGALAFAVVAPLLPVSGIQLAVAATLTAGAGILPDLDEPGSTIARTFGFLTGTFAWIVHRISGGHRKLPAAVPAEPLRVRPATRTGPDHHQQARRALGHLPAAARRPGLLHLPRRQPRPDHGDVCGLALRCSL